MRRILFMLIIGLGGAAILLWLGTWQMQRLAWKEAVIAEINARIVDAPVDLPAQPNPQTDAYLPVQVSGQFSGDTLRVLVSQKKIGAGYRLITALETSAGRILIDRGLIATDEAPNTPTTTVTFTGNLQWPQETDSFTPSPEVDENVWFARDVPYMAEALNTRPILVVARTATGDDPTIQPFPVDTARIPNDHLQYAITWFSLAAIWVAMTFLFLRRRRTTSQTES